MLANDRKLAAADADNANRKRDMAVSLERIGKAKLNAGDSAGALAAYEEGLGIRRRLAETEAANEQYKQELSTTIERVGDIKRDLGDSAGALSSIVRWPGPISATPSASGWCRSTSTRLPM